MTVDVVIVKMMIELLAMLGTTAVRVASGRETNHSRRLPVRFTVRPCNWVSEIRSCAILSWKTCTFNSGAHCRIEIVVADYKGFETVSLCDQ
jgi:hypothetical protein